MSGRRLALLAAVLAVCVVLARVAWRHEQPDRPQASPLANASDKISQIDISPPGAPPIRLISVDGRWRLKTPVDDAADTKSLTRLVTALCNFSYGAIVSESPAHQAQFEVNDASATRVTVQVRGKEKPALDLLVGKPTADLESSFVRAPGETAVRSADGLSSFLLRNDVSSFRDLAVVPLSFDSLNGLSATWKGETMSLLRSSATWTTGSGKTLDASQLAQLRGRVNGLQVSEFASTRDVGKTEATVTFSSGTTRIGVTFGPVEKRPQGPSVRRAIVDGRPTALFVSDDAVTGLLDFLRSLR